MKGLVMRSTGSWYSVKSEDGGYFECNLRGKIKLEESKISNPIAVGDHVVFEIEKDTKGIIIEIEPRQNYLIRKSTRKTAHGHILASNLDQCILIASLVFPRTSIGFIDRFLVAAESFRIPAKIIFNKSDLLDDHLKSILSELMDLYQSLGYENTLISAKTDSEFKVMNEWIKGKKTLFAGHSGVGKSTLLNRIKPDLNLATSEVSSFANKGTHTTTFAAMIELEDDTYVIDTPGIKELGLMDMENWEISHYFPEMRDKLGECKYHNCVHVNEPGCEVVAAVNSGEIDYSRYDSYLSMIIGDDNRR